MPVESPLNSVHTLRVEHSLDSDVGFNILHYQLVQATVIATGLPMATNPIASDVCQALGNAFISVYYAVWNPAASTAVTFDGCTVQKVYPGDRSVPYHVPNGGAAAGTVAGDAMPLQDTVTILKKTGYGQRWGQGRFYFVGLAEASNNKGFIGAGAVAAIGAMGATLAGDIVCDDGTNQYTMRPVLTNVPTTGLPRINRITSMELSNDTIKTQRRRRPGKGI